MDMQKIIQIKETLEFIKQKKRVAERNIIDAIGPILSKLEDDTGFTPSNITIVLEDVTVIGDLRRRRMIVDVKIDINL
jgi:hypothetical protein